MRIEFKCSGGIANLRLEYQADTEQLPKNSAEELTALLKTAQLSDLEPTAEQQGALGAVDAFAYQLCVYDEEQKNTYRFSDVTAPDEVRPLLDHLRDLAVEQKLKGNS